MGEAGQMAQKRSKRIPGLEPYRRRPPNGTFETLQFEARRKAQMLLWGFCQRWGNDLPPWRRAILVGQAKRLALNSPDSAWARRTLAKRGGLAVREKYRREGIDPTAKGRRRGAVNCERIRRRNPKGGRE